MLPQPSFNLKNIKNLDTILKHKLIGDIMDTRSENIDVDYWLMDSRDNYGKTALFFAVENNNSKTVKLLLDNKENDIRIIKC